ncbi:MAG TPA: DUF2505 family protein [Byssovorax sp.]
MKFAVSHEIDAPLDAVELALLSAELPERIAAAMHDVGGPRIEAIEPVEQRFESGTLTRVLRYQAAAPVPALERFLDGRPAARDMLAWIERLTYVTRTHAGTFDVSPIEPYARFFRAHGTVTLEALADGKTRRSIDGELDVNVRLVAPVVERLAVAEVKKVYAAEAAALRALAVL